MTDKTEEGVGCKTGLTQRHGDAPVDGPVVGAIDEGGLQKGVRDGSVDKGAEDEDTKPAGQTWKEEDPDGVVEMEVPDVQDVAGNQAAAEKGGDKHIEGEKAADFQPLMYQHESKHRGGQQRQCSTGYGDKDGDNVRIQQGSAGAEQVGIGFQAPFGGEEAVAVVSDAFCTAERNGDNEDQRQYGQDGENAHQDIQSQVGAEGDLIAAVSAAAFHCLFHDKTSFA